MLKFRIYIVQKNKISISKKNKNAKHATDNFMK
jgi:hypothetical protein